jgi:hypothetical protein|tara:strand:- start:370 stop:489 length:120 start_codon:yes stop_codon:yes gene_type:complete
MLWMMLHLATVTVIGILVKETFERNFQEYADRVEGDVDN